MRGLSLQTVRDHPLRAITTLVLGVGQIALAYVASINLLTVHVPPEEHVSWIAPMAANDIWIWMFSFLGAWCITAVLLRKGMMSVTAASASVLSIWGITNLLWGLSRLNADPRLPLGLPIAVLMVAAMAYTTSRAWAIIDQQEQQRRYDT